jgi:hypothetical protein
MSNKGNSLAMLAELTLAAFYGGKIRTAEQSFDSRQVMQWLAQMRDRLLAQKLSNADRDKEQPDDLWFSVYQQHQMLWDDIAEVVYIDLPKGYVDMTNDAAIRIKPVKGSANPFVRIPGGWMAVSPEMAWLEGNVGWELQPGGVVKFPGLRQADMGFVTLYVIEPVAEVDPDKPLNMPSGFVATAQDMVLELMGRSRGEDKNADNRDQI